MPRITSEYPGAPFLIKGVHLAFATQSPLCLRLTHFRLPDGAVHEVSTDEIFFLACFGMAALERKKDVHKYRCNCIGDHFHSMQVIQVSWSVHVTLIEKRLNLKELAGPVARARDVAALACWHTGTGGNVSSW